jgi:uncharacterized protein involved in exopolysaccharide biosynthesis
MGFLCESMLVIKRTWCSWLAFTILFVCAFKTTTTTTASYSGTSPLLLVPAFEQDLKQSGQQPFVGGAHNDCRIGVKTSTQSQRVDFKHRCQSHG